MGSMNNERDPMVVSIPIGTQAAGITLPGCYFRKHSRIKNVWLVDQAGIAADPSNKYVVTLQDNAGSPVSYASVDTHTSAAVALTQLPLVLTTPVGDTTNQPEADVPAGTMLNVKLTKTGTVTTTDAVLLIEWYPL